MPKIVFSNEMRQEYCGFALFSAHQIGCVFINEQKNRKLGLRAISSPLPLFDRPKVSKGMYRSHDYKQIRLLEESYSLSNPTRGRG